MPAPDAAVDAAAGGRARLADRLRRELPVGQWLGLSIGALLLLAVVVISLALSANATVGDRRSLLVDRIAPAQLAAADLAGALVTQETGVRGYLISGEPGFLQPYGEGLSSERRDYARLLALLRGGGAGLAADARAVKVAADAWRSRYVLPTVLGHDSTLAATAAGRRLFDQVRASLRRLTAALAARRHGARDDLFSAGGVLTISLILAGLLIVAGLLAAGIVLRRAVTAPLERLGDEARRVAGGDYGVSLAALDGAREIVEVRGEVEAMRELIVRELRETESARARLEAQARELARSNKDLEQFAYVASHDLQEPLRKVTSFCQALQQRYAGRLDERADSYIHFAVDGAQRMQVLINDLLSFSRAGRSGLKLEAIDTAELVEQVWRSLSPALEEAGAQLVVENLPEVLGDVALLRSVFQNLISNAIKFRGPEPPVITLAAARGDAAWEFSCTDNGIGVEPEYAERIFAIFQRLHSKESYPGTGIGLAMCRKIVEYHGGEIWLDPAHEGGARIRFTLPIRSRDDPD